MSRLKTFYKQVEGKKSVRKAQAAYLYKVYASPPEANKADLRAIAEQALGEWQNKNHHRVGNLSDHLRRKY